MIVVDYLQLMQGPTNTESRQQEISYISRSLKALARELKVPVVALSQLRAHRSSARERTSARSFPICASRAQSSRTPIW